MRTLVEICVDSVAGAVTAERAGADRIELCAGLVEGGTTPSIGMLRQTLAAVGNVGVQVLIRPRGGDFCYDRCEIDVMLADIAAVRRLEPAPETPVGFVIGALTPDGEVDLPATAALVDACGGAPVTFHKAFDAARDLPAALESLAELGVRRLLTSGGRARAADAVPVLAGLVRQAAGRLVVLAGGGIRPDNVAAVVGGSGVREVHLRASASTPSPVRFWREGPEAASPGDRLRTVTSADVIADLRRALRIAR